jgi:hypothetical protein
MSIAILRSSIRRSSIRNLTTNDISNAKILTMIKTGTDADFKSMFRLSRPVFLAASHDLSPWLKDCRSRNSRKYVPAEKKIGIAQYYTAHGGDGVDLGVVSDLSEYIKRFPMSKIMCPLCKKHSYGALTALQDGCDCHD